MSQSAEQSVPMGFSDVDTVREIVRRLKMRAALKEVRNSIEELLELLDKSIQADRDRSASLFDEAGNLLPAEVERLQRDAAINAVARKDMREQELLDGMKLVLELLDRIGVGIRHGLFSSCGGEGLMCADGFSHRLCEPGKHTRGNSRKELNVLEDRIAEFFLGKNYGVAAEWVARQLGVPFDTAFRRAIQRLTTSGFLIAVPSGLFVRADK